MRLLRCAAQKLIFSPPSQALPGTAVVRRLRLIPSPGRAWGRERVPFLLEGLASALWTTPRESTDSELESLVLYAFGTTMRNTLRNASEALVYDAAWLISQISA